MDRTMRTCVRLGAALALCAVVVGCTPPAAPTPPPSALPTPTPTPSRTETALERQQRLDFEAAEKAYRANEAERERLYKLGGATEATPLLRRTSAESYLEVVVSLLVQAKKSGVRLLEPARIVHVSWGGHSPTEVLLRSCVDNSTARFVARDGRMKSGSGVVLHKLVVRKIDSNWKVVKGDFVEIPRVDDYPECRAR